jgi:hypothetical protein
LTPTTTRRSSSISSAPRRPPPRSPLQEPLLDRGDRAAERLDLRHELPGPLADLARPLLDEVRAAERVRDVGDAVS